VPISADADGASPADQVVITPRLLVSPPYEQIAYEFLLTKAETTIGRAGSSDLLLDSDNMTSRHHAMIQRINERVLIFDKRSNNGVFVNGQQIAVGEGYELVDGDHITIGSYELVFRDTLPRTEIDE
jgi:pSer/pThr/pTyr-binding forkhead associated (FHA) protein